MIAVNICNKMAVILIGLPGSGKSTFAEKYLTMCEVFSTDKYREKFTGSVEDQSQNKRVFKTIYEDTSRSPMHSRAYSPSARLIPTRFSTIYLLHSISRKRLVKSNLPMQYAKWLMHIRTFCATLWPTVTTELFRNPFPTSLSTYPSRP